MAKKKKPHGNLTLFILIAIVSAILMALIFPHFAASFHLGGEVFLRLLKMMVVPLVVASVMTGIMGMGDVRKLGKPGAAAVVYYLSTTILAVAVGLVVVNVIRPGEGTVDAERIAETSGGVSEADAKAKVRQRLAKDTGLSEEEVAKAFDDLPSPREETRSVAAIFKNLVLMLFTDNLFAAATKGDLLPLIVFSIIFAGMLTTMGSRVENIVTMIEQVNEALMAFIMLLMKLAPLGIFCLVAGRFGEAQAEGKFVAELQQTFWYVLTVLVGLAIHAFLTLPAIYWFFTRKNPYRFMYQMSQALLTAFSTASSSATLPVTMECAQENAGIGKEATEFVLPLGATINMDGTALYEAAAAIFIAQVAPDVHLTFADQLVVAMTATLAAIGAAGIPEAGLVTMLIVLNAVGLPLHYIGLILSVDWLLDRFRTAVNAFGDSVGAAVVEQTMPDVESQPAAEASTPPPPAAS